MKSNACHGVGAGSGRRFARSMPVLRYGILAAAAVLAGCSDDVVMKDPRTGMTEICPESLRGFNPWSQTMACVGAHEAQGWVRAGRP